jgi:hypothetical protein
VIGETVRREKALDFSGCNSHPGNWFAPPGNNRSGGEGNRTVGSFGAKGQVGDSVSVQAVT